MNLMFEWMRTYGMSPFRTHILVVDTVGFNDKTWLDGEEHPHSDALQLVERIRRVNYDALTIDFTIDDPKAYIKPWVARETFELKPGWNIGERVGVEDNANFLETEKMLDSKQQPRK